MEERAVCREREAFGMERAQWTMRHVPLNVHSVRVDKT
jgi:hypothetical protein